MRYNEGNLEGRKGNGCGGSGVRGLKWGSAVESDRGDFWLIKARLRKQQTVLPLDGELAAACVQNMRADGSWADVDYETNSGTVWEAREHLARLLHLARAYAKAGGDFLGDAAVREAVLRGLAFWYAGAFCNPNWWQNDIGKQLELREIALLMEAELPQERMEAVVADLQTEVPASYTGANALWIAQNVLYRGLFTHNAELVRYAVAQMAATVRMAQSMEDVDGIQPDYSFTQHGRQLYSNGYGRSYFTGIAAWCFLLRDTFAAFPPQAIRLVTDLFLNGHRWMFRYDACDYGTLGREFTRQHHAGRLAMQDYLPALGMLAELQEDPVRRAGLEAAMAHIRGEQATPGVTGNRMFWRVDYMAHLRAPFFASVRMLSRDVTGGEEINRENLVGGFGAYGASCFMTHGAEYQGIFGLWDWTHLPGVTAPAVALPTGLGAHMDSTFVGGVSDGTFGMAAMCLDKTYQWPEGAASARLAGKKAAFFWEDGVLFLGAGLACDAPQPVNTTINQCHLRGRVLLDGAAVPQTDALTVRHGTVVWHDGIGYVFPDGQDVLLKNGPQTGNWRTITQAPDAPQEDVSGDIFLLCLSHGVHPQGGTYCYAVLPGISQDCAAAYAADGLPWEIRNDDVVQAAWHSALGVGMAAFYTAGETVLGGQTIRVDSPCLLLRRRTDQGDSYVLSCPYRCGGSVGVTVTDRSGCRRVAVPLPTEAIRMGASVPFSVS